MLIGSMTIQQALQREIEDSKRWIDIEKDDSTYKRDLHKRIELINWVLEKMNNPDISICEVIESKMSEIIDKIKQIDSAIEADPLHCELRILDWILFKVWSNEIFLLFIFPYKFVFWSSWSFYQSLFDACFK
jgi:hypothetical protein